MISPMRETPWERLSRLAYARIDHLGITQTDLEHKYGGPSPAWLRRLKTLSGKPSTRQARSLRELSLALGWTAETAWSLLSEDRSDWSKDSLLAEEFDLVFGDGLTDTERSIRDFQTIIAARLRVLPQGEAEEVMRKILADLGIS